MGNECKQWIFKVKGTGMTKLDGKVIVITGGTQGVGEAVALHSAHAGAAGVVDLSRFALA